MQRNTEHLAITPSMKKSDVLERIQAAKDYFLTPQFSIYKKDILKGVIAYAEENFVKLLSRSQSRYTMYADMLELATHLDDIHFLCYAKRELQKIHEWDSLLRTSVLPIANQKLKVALAPTIARRQKFALSLCMGGFAMLLSRYAPAGSAFIVAGLACYLASHQIVELQLNNSLLIKENRLAGGVDHTHLIQDGMEDTFSRLEGMGNNLLTASLGIFSGLTNQMARIAAPLQPLLPAPQQQPARVQVLEDEDNAAAQAIKRNHI